MRARGFTLLELIIAVAIFAVLAAISYNGLNSVLRARALTQVQGEQLQALQITSSFLYRDFRQLIPYSSRDQYGDYQAPLLFNDAPDSYIEFTRMGWHNPAQQLRSQLQRVRYGIEDNQLYREYWLQALQPVAAVPTRQILLNDIESIEFEFQATDGELYSQWPPANQPDNTALPKLIKLSLVLKDERTLEYWFVVTI